MVFLELKLFDNPVLAKTVRNLLITLLLTSLCQFHCGINRLGAFLVPEDVL